MSNGNEHLSCVILLMFIKLHKNPDGLIKSQTHTVKTFLQLKKKGLGLKSTTEDPLSVWIIKADENRCACLYSTQRQR